MSEGEFPAPAVPAPGSEAAGLADGGARGAAVSPAAGKLGVWTFLATEVLLFGGLFTAYVVFRLEYPKMFHEGHLHLDRILGAANTVILITSSLTVALALAAVRRGEERLLRLFLFLTLLLAAAFLAVKYFEWSAKFAQGIYPGTDIFFGLYFMMTGLHGLHVLGGMVVLGTIFFLARGGRFGPCNHAPVEIGALYWHFVDLVWIYLFPLFYLIG